MKDQKNNRSTPHTANMPTITVRRLPDDPLCTRVSLGGTSQTGYYCLFRGNQKDVLTLLSLAATAMKNVPELEIEKDDPRLQHN